MWNHGKLSAKFLASNVQVFDTVSLCHFFFNFTRTAIKIPLKHLSEWRYYDVFQLFQYSLWYLVFGTVYHDATIEPRELKSAAVTVFSVA